jgi:hypothetical protein
MEPQSWLVKLLVYGLAVYRVTRLFVYENGPSNIFERLRTWAGTNQNYYETTLLDGRKGKWIVKEGFLGGLLACPLCLSVWISAIAAICLYLKKALFDAMATWLALSAIATVLFNHEGEE